MFEANILCGFLLGKKYIFYPHIDCTLLQIGSMATVLIDIIY